MNLVIRSEASGDVANITRVTAAAFASLAISDQREPFVVLALRAAGALAISLVAEVDGRLVGHIAFSPVVMSDGTPGWYGLGPVSVLPECQRRGIGKALIREGLARLRKMDARGCCLVGHPEYYPALGFVHPEKLVFEGVPTEAFFVLSFDGIIPRGAVTFHAAFMVEGAPGPA